MFQVTSAARRRGAESCDSDDEDEEETDERRRERGGEENITQMAQPLGEPETSIPISEQLQVRTLRSCTLWCACIRLALFALPSLLLTNVPFFSANHHCRSSFQPIISLIFDNRIVPFGHPMICCPHPTAH